MSNHGFLLKGWMITIVAGLVALSVTESKPALALVGMLAAAFMWCLDGYFLWREKHFIALYNRVRDASEIDFNMAPNSVKGDCKRYREVMLQPALWPFYLGAMVIPVLSLIGEAIW